MDKQMESICGSPLWDPETVYSKYPDLTYCFQNTYLKWLPCALLWLVSILWLYRLGKRYNEYPFRFSCLFLLKLTAIALLILVEIYHLIIAAVYSNSTNQVQFITPTILISTYMLTMLINYLEYRTHLKYSMLLFCYWLISTLFALVPLRTKIIHLIIERTKSNNQEENVEENKTNKYDYDVFVYFGLLVINLVLVSFTQKFNQADNDDYDNKKQNTIKYKVSMISYLTFWWSNILINTGYKRDLKQEDLWKLDENLRCENLSKEFERVWNQASKPYLAKLQEINYDLDDANAKKKKLKRLKKEKKEKSSNKNNNKEEEEIQLNDMSAANNADEVEVAVTTSSKEEAAAKLKKPSLTLALVKVFIGQFLTTLAIKVIHDLLNFARPLLLDKMITFIKNKEQNISLGVFYVALLCLTSFIQTLMMQHFFNLQFLNGNRMKLSLMNVIYKKSFKLTASSRKSLSVGEMTNILTTNVNSFEWTPFHLISMISAPLQILISTYLLWKYLGPATLAGMATMIIFIPLNTVFANLSKKITRKQYKFQDKRLKMMNEIFAGIRVVKFYGWELSFKKLVKHARMKEVKNLMNSSFISTVSQFIWSMAPFMVATVSFAVYLLMSEENNLDPNTAFVSLTLFTMLRFPLNILPHIINGLIQLNVSLTRIRRLLLKEETNEADIQHKPDEKIAVEIRNGSFGWNKTTPTIKNVNLSVKHGELVAIIGKVGCGKSSLLSAILGEMHKIRNEKTTDSSFCYVNVNGQTAYVPQQAWIQNKTLKENILFGCHLDQTMYEKILDACSLLPDLELMPAGDETEIGEKGINLSGGQKQRVSLARSIYSNADIYLLDDPLSAVDSHVGKHIFDSVLCSRTGLLRNKTRLFVTNSLSFLPRVDKVIVVDNGRLVEMGTYADLMQNPDKNSPFNAFMQNFNSQQQQQLQRSKSENEREENEELKEKEKEKEKQSKSKDEKKSTSAGGSGRKIIQQEKIESGQVNRSVVIEYLKACSIFLSAIFLILYLMSQVAHVGSNFWLSAWADETRNKTFAEQRKYYRLGVYAALGFADCMCTFLANLSFLVMLIKATNLLHDKMLHSVLRAPLRFFESTPTGRILNRFTTDIKATESEIPYSIKSLLACFLSLVSVVVTISRSTPFFLTALVPIAIFYVFVQRYFVPTSRQLKRLKSASRSPIYSHFTESQNGVSTIKAYNGQQRFVRQMQENINNNFRVTFAENISNRWLALRLEIIGNLVTICAAVFAIITRDTLTAGLAGMSISVSLNVTQTLSWFVKTMSEFEANITSVERIKEYCDLKHEAEWSSEDDKKPPVEWPQHGEIVFRDFSLKYRAELENVLENLNIHVKPGEKIGICGRTGAGKSSLTMGLFRILELTSGDILIDNVNINEIGLHDLRHKLTIIPQDPIIFSGTLRMNLDPFEAYSDDMLWRALELSYLKEFVMSLENKLDYECTEGGENLSVGQRQLICLARALLRKTKILILDEATASVDHNTDELIQKTIRDSFADCTVLTIAHRLNTIMDYTRIIVLDKGRIAEFDEPKKLLENKSSQFYSMAKSAKLI